MRINLLILFFICAQGLFAQDEQLLPLVYNQLQLKETLKSIAVAKEKNNGQRGGSMELPFVDDFSTDKFPGNSDEEPVHWMNRTAYRNLTYGLNPPTIGVASLDGSDEYGYPYSFSGTTAGLPADTLESVSINLEYPSSANVYFSFFYQGKGLGDAPEIGDSLVLEFYAPQLEQWFHIWSTAGVTMEEFDQVFIPITQTKYLLNDFRFRFVNYATLKGPLDHWHVDYIQLDQNRTEGEIIDDVAFRYPISTLLATYSSMPWKHFRTNAASFMAQDIQVLAYNNNDGNRTIFGRELEIEFEGASQSVYNNLSEPPIFAQTELALDEAVLAAPHNYVYDIDVNDTCAVFDVFIRNTITPDLLTTNNEIKFKQEFVNYYAYDDGSPERAYGTTLTGSKAALRYNNALADSLIGLWIWFEALNNNPGQDVFFPFVWTSTSSGPGDVLAQGFWSDIQFEPEEYVGWRYYPMSEPVYIPEGAFFVGYAQSVEFTLNVGNDMNTNFNEGRLYYQTSSGWLPSTVDGTLMIRPAFQAPKGDPLSVADLYFTEANVYPNPANDNLYIQSGQNELVYIDLMDVAGKVVLKTEIFNQGNVDISSLQNGVYLLRLSAKSGAQRVLKVMKN
jgi:hypothetical protein